MTEQTLQDLALTSHQLIETTNQFLAASDYIHELEVEREELLRELALSDAVVERVSQPWDVAA